MDTNRSGMRMGLVRYKYNTRTVTEIEVETGLRRTTFRIQRMRTSNT